LSVREINTPSKREPVDTYSKTQTIIANIPYTAMILLGAVIILYTPLFPSYTIAIAGGYAVYGIAGAFWIMIFVCPYCRFYATSACPCGYGAISAKIVKQRETDGFAEKFRRHIPVIVPLWIIPVACGGFGLWRSFSWGLAGLVVTFIIESWIFLPLVSKKHGCAECPQKEECPWMGKKDE
jgi:hypothetical protein